jgi:hypothetical protein
VRCPSQTPKTHSMSPSQRLLSLCRFLLRRPSLLLRGTDPRTCLGAQGAPTSTAACTSKPVTGLAPGEQTSRLLQPGYLTVYCGDQFGNVHRFPSL